VLPGPDRGARGPRGGDGSTAVTVRSATAEDATALVELLQAGAIGTSDEDPGDLTPYWAALEEIGESPGTEMLVIEHEGRVVGACQLITFRHLQQRGGRCAEIESMHVAPEFRGIGIGGLLLEAAVDAARAAGCYRVQLTSNAARVDAHDFYERHGFTGSHVGFKRTLESPG
jgi:GNAT superfamily N-acetyltransferase